METHSKTMGKRLFFQGLSQGWKAILARQKCSLRHGLRAVVKAGAKDWFRFVPNGRAMGRHGPEQRGWAPSGHGGKCVRRPVSRVLSTALAGGWMAIHLGRRLPGRLARPTRTTARKCAPLLENLGKNPRISGRAVPTWSCSRWGLPCRPCCQARGALLPHPFTLTGRQVALRTGGLLSVALSLGSPPPDVIRHRISVEPGLSSPR